MTGLDNHCGPGKCCICAMERMCLSLDEDNFILARRCEIIHRLLYDTVYYQTYEIELMRKTLIQMDQESRENKEKEDMEKDIYNMTDEEYLGEMGKSAIKSGIEYVKEELDKAYKKGLEEAWGIARKITLYHEDGGYSCDELKYICNDDDPYKAYKNMSIHEVKEKIAAYEAEQAKPKLGDVVEIGDIGEFLFLGEGREHYYVLDPSDNDGIPHQFVIKHTANSIRKTGKHFDIQSMLDEIG